MNHYLRGNSGSWELIFKVPRDPYKDFVTRSLVLFILQQNKSPLLITKLRSGCHFALVLICRWRVFQLWQRNKSLVCFHVCRNFSLFKFVNKPSPVSRETFYWIAQYYVVLKPFLRKWCFQTDQEISPLLLNVSGLARLRCCHKTM